MTAPAAPAASFGSVDEAMDTARAALGYLARADVASLPAVTQARLQPVPPPPLLRRRSSETRAAAFTFG